MSRIGERFAEIERDAKKGFIPFVTAGDPDLDVTLAIVLKLATLGADVIELGVPFSDPMADGPTIQMSSQRALENGVKTTDVIDLVKRVRERSDIPIVLFSYLNPLLQIGIEKIARTAAAAGVDGVLLTDAVDQEAADFSAILADSGIDLISLIAPTTTDERLARIGHRSTGFLYAVSRAGVTGARSEKSLDAESLVRRARKFTDLPVAVGFGISTREQIVDVWRYADAAVVGSAIVNEIATHPENPVGAVDLFVSRLLPEFAKSGAEL